MIGCSDPSIRLVGRWYRIGEKAVASAPGSHFYFAFQGRHATMHFATNLMLAPYPHLWICVDGGPMVETQLDQKLSVHTKEEGNHVVEVIFKSAIEMAHRWYQPLAGKVEFLGYEADKPGKLPPMDKKTIEFVGDSITEGV